MLLAIHPECARLAGPYLALVRGHGKDLISPKWKGVIR